MAIGSKGLTPADLDGMDNERLFVNQTKRTEAPQPDGTAPETVTKEDKK